MIADLINQLSPNRIKKLQKLGRNGRVKFFKKLRLHSYQHGKCFYCFVDIQLGKGTIDHYIPKSKGGKNGIHNLVLSCSRCNQRKGNKTVGRPLIREELKTLTNQ